MKFGQTFQEALAHSDYPEEWQSAAVGPHIYVVKIESNAPKLILYQDTIQGIEEMHKKGYAGA